ncbi:MAG: hydroxysqualene dehydroxylase HpnE [Fimbriiglobus sp.]
MKTVQIIGGGLAGLAAAVALGSRGYRVTVLESRQRLGGRAGSFTDPTTGQMVDACQHVSMGCCTNLAHFCRVVGIEHHLEPQPVLYFQTPDRRVSRFTADPWPAPFHLGRALLGAHYLTVSEKLRIAYGLACLRQLDPADDQPLMAWLEAHRQTPRTIARYWAIVLVSALNESIERVGVKYARKVFVEGFMAHRDGFRVEVPKVPLGRLYGEELRAWFVRHGVELRENAGVKEIEVEHGEVKQLHLRDGSTHSADETILAVPFDRVTALLPEAWRRQVPFSLADQLEPSPITSVHLWYDRPITELPHVVMLDSVCQWLFSRGESSPGEHYVQVVVSAARELRGLGREEIERRVILELQQFFPIAATAKLIRSKVVTEHTATFSAIPGIDAIRPPQATPIAGLTLAGDWTQTGWPATMEGAVRSGYLAAEVILAYDRRPEKLVQPDLG